VVYKTKSFYIVNLFGI